MRHRGPRRGTEEDDPELSSIARAFKAEVERHSRAVGRIEAELERGLREAPRRVVGDSAPAAAAAAAPPRRSAASADASDFFLKAAMQLSGAVDGGGNSPTSSTPRNATPRRLRATATAAAASSSMCMPPLTVLRRATLRKLKKGLGTAWAPKCVVLTPESMIWFDTDAAFESACTAASEDFSAIDAEAFLVDAAAGPPGGGGASVASPPGGGGVGTPLGGGGGGPIVAALPPSALSSLSSSSVGAIGGGAGSGGPLPPAFESPRRAARGGRRASAVLGASHKTRVALLDEGLGGTATVVRLLRTSTDGSVSDVRCVASLKFKKEPVFELVAGTICLARFRCTDVQTRDAWIADVDATRVELEGRRARLALCEALRDSVASATSSQRYLAALRGRLPAAPGVRVPLWWVRNAVQSGGVGAASYDYRQIFKDLQRDSVEVRSGAGIVERFEPPPTSSRRGGEDDSGRWADTRTSRVISALARTVHAALRSGRCSPVRRGRAAIDEVAVEARILRFVHALLLACNRTASGGDSFTLIFSMLAAPGVVHIMPLANAGAPLIFHVGSEVDRRGELGVVVRFELSSSFKIADVSNPSGALASVHTDFRYSAWFGGASEGSIAISRGDAGSGQQQA